jgi:ubiquinone/menaquinone biosynthesis C-methylase UbiE
MHVKKGQRLLDVGCGPGGDAMALARLVGRKGFVVGVDSERGFIETAQRCALSAGLASRMHFRIVDLLPLPFRSDEFDATRSERTFQHLTDPEPALAEMVRVTRPGGRMVLVDIDWVSASVDSPFPGVERLLKRILIDEVIPNPYAGRSLYRLMRAQRLEEIEVESVPVTISALHDLRQLANFDRCEAIALERALISEERLAQWRAALVQAEAERTLFAQVNLLLVAGVVPAA